ncbi:MAG: hypothetical protein LBE95_00790, partial [Holosporaceae bacterium]|nr:hypothetical protein [Holosporaceae bacterium]
NYFTETRGSHEPFFAIPLVAGGGRYQKFDIELIRAIKSAESHSRGGFVKNTLHHAEYLRLQLMAIDALKDKSIEINRKQKLKKIAKLSHIYMLHLEIEQELSKICEDSPVPISKVNEVEWFLTQFQKYINDVQDYVISTLRRGAYEKVIAYGVLGQRGRKYLPLLSGLGIRFDEMWDIAANGQMIGEKKVVPPDLSRLDEKSLVCVFPKKIDICFGNALVVRDMESLILLLQFDDYMKT